jgi:hypothetical protein
MPGDLFDRLVVDERAVGDAVVEAVADLEGVDLFGEPGGEVAIDVGLDEDPVGADAGLARGAELGGDGALHGLVQVGVVEDLR